MTMIVNDEVYLSTDEAMKYLGTTRHTLNELAKAGRLQKYKQGFKKSIYYKQVELDQIKALHPVDEND